MTIYGLDFTSAPRRSKPITCASCQLLGTQLVVRDFLTFSDFAQFEGFLAREGPWLAALDFPFGLPLRLLHRLSWPLEWSGYMRHVSTMGRGAFEEILNDYRKRRPAGDKLHLRQADVLAGARSPMMMHRVPVGKMFFEGASRLFAAQMSILPCRPLHVDRIAIEGYPALVARKYIGKQPYKSDERAKQTPERLHARHRLMDALLSDALAAHYGLALGLRKEHAARLLEEPAADSLDALLCAIQAAWAYRLRQQGYGIPLHHEVEGWIVDPALLP